MLQNLKPVIDLCSGEDSQSAVCIQSWIEHIMKHRQIYFGCQEADNTFLSKVFFAIDRALQIHWKSCVDCLDRTSVNDKILFMSDIQTNIERHNFTYLLPKSFLDKFKPNPEDGSQIGSGNPGNEGKGGLKGGKRFPFDKDKGGYNKKLRVTDDHNQWHLKEGEHFSDLFWSNQEKCPKTKEGSLICMKFFIRGFCDKTCLRAHKLTKQEEKDFAAFVSHCRNKDFQQGTEEEKP
jgi:hypothetical protein